MTTKFIRGQIVHGWNGEENVLGLLSESYYTDFFVELFQRALDFKNRQVTIRYILSDKLIPQHLVSLELAYFQMGRATAEYGMAYSDITGYLWTTEKAQVGGHDLVAELSQHMGKFLHMEIEY